MTMTTNIEVRPGDRVRDPLDDNAIREVERVDGSTLYMTDGGVLGLEEVNEVFLPSELLE